MGSALGKRVAPEDGHLSAMEEGRGAAMVAATEQGKDGQFSKMEEGKEQVQVSQVEGKGKGKGRGGAATSGTRKLADAMKFGFAFYLDITEVLRDPPAAMCRALEAAPPEAAGIRGLRSKLRRVVELAMEEEDRASDKVWWGHLFEVASRAGRPRVFEETEHDWAKRQEEDDRLRESLRKKFWEVHFPPQEEEEEEEEEEWAEGEGMAARMRREVYWDTPVEELGWGSRELLKYLARANQSPADAALLRALEELPPLAEPLAEAAPPHYREGRVVADSPEEEERLWKEMKQRWAQKSEMDWEKISAVRQGSERDEIDGGNPDEGGEMSKVYSKSNGG